MKINNKFYTYEKLGKELHHKIACGWEITCDIKDEFGNGELIFRGERGNVFVPFTEINVGDIVEMEYNELAEVKRSYK